MKKFIVLMLVLGMTGTASAGSIDLVCIGNTDLGGDGPGIAQAGDVYDLAIQVGANAETDAYSLSVTPVTTLTATATLEETPPDGIIQPGEGFPIHLPPIVGNTIPQIVGMSMGFWGPGTLLVYGFHITIGGTSGTVDVVIADVTAGGYMTRTRTPPDTGPWQYPGTLDPLSASLPITVIPPEPACWNDESICYGDADLDDDADGFDFIKWKNAWYYGGWIPLWNDPHGTGNGEYNPCADFQRDGDVDGMDFILWKNTWTGAVPFGTDCNTNMPWPPAGFP